MGPTWPALLVDLLFPPRCVVTGCRQAGAWLCPNCLGQVRGVPSPRCWRCGAPLAGGACRDCAVSEPAFDLAVAGGLYAAPLREAIQALKYRSVAPLARPLARLAARSLPDVAELVVVAVPGHQRRVAGRGIDHAGLLARQLADITGLLQWRGLIRRRSTRPQAALGPVERRENLREAFAVVGGPAPRRVLLVDDILTTGATASACAATLRAAGTRRVIVCTVARAG